MMSSYIIGYTVLILSKKHVFISWFSSPAPGELNTLLYHYRFLSKLSEDNGISAIRQYQSCAFEKVSLNEGKTEQPPSFFTDISAALFVIFCSMYCDL
jgi:hypothetical protein